MIYIIFLTNIGGKFLKNVVKTTYAYSPPAPADTTKPATMEITNIVITPDLVDTTESATMIITNITLI